MYIDVCVVSCRIGRFILLSKTGNCQRKIEFVLTRCVTSHRWTFNIETVSTNIVFFVQYFYCSQFPFRTTKGGRFAAQERARVAPNRFTNPVCSLKWHLLSWHIMKRVSLGIATRAEFWGNCRKRERNYEVVLSGIFARLLCQLQFNTDSPNFLCHPLARASCLILVKSEPFYCVFLYFPFWPSYYLRNC